MTIAALVMTDGRVDCLARTLASFDEQVFGDVRHLMIWDDTGDDDHFDYLRRTHPKWQARRSSHGRQGFGGAIRSAWEQLTRVGCDHVFHCEDDFTFNQPVDLDSIAAVLDLNPHLAQMALRRQAWNDVERAAGGVVETNPAAYTDRFRIVYAHDPPVFRWLEHRLFFTTNVSLFRRPLLEVGWPEGEGSEGRFTHQLLTDGFDGFAGEDVAFGYWGPRQSEPWVHHIGEQRVGTGY